MSINLLLQFAFLTQLTNFLFKNCLNGDQTALKNYFAIILQYFFFAIFNATTLRCPLKNIIYLPFKDKYF